MIIAEGKEYISYIVLQNIFFTVSVIVIDYCLEKFIWKFENILSLEAGFLKTYFYSYMSSQIT